MNQLFESRLCPVCNGERFSVISPRSYPKDISRNDLQRMYSSSSSHMLMDQLVQCNCCNLTYINPQVRDDIIFSSYENAVDPAFIKQNPLRILTFHRNLIWLCKRFNIKPSLEKKVLDVGCAGGAFPVAASELGFTVIGVEPSRWLAEQARNTYGLDIRSGSLESQKFPPSSFDLITLWDVIEHLTTPSLVVGNIHQLLAKNGLLVINYPDYDSLTRRFMGMRWPFFLSVHLIYFTPKTIRRFLDERGFDVLVLRPYWQTLELGYALERAGAYFKLFEILARLINYIGLGGLPLRYNMGQTLLVARKRS